MIIIESASRPGAKALICQLAERKKYTAFSSTEFDDKLEVQTCNLTFSQIDLFNNLDNTELLGPVRQITEISGERGLTVDFFTDGLLNS